MPDIDPDDLFGDFDRGVPVSPLPASEIRRRGDRLRRRNTALASLAGVVAVTTLVGVPLALTSQRGGEIQPAPPAPTRTEWRTEIPGGWPLTTGMTTQGEPAIGDLDAFTLCETAFPRGEGTTDTVTAYFSGDGESSAQRTLQLWPDAETAEAVLDGLTAAVQECPEQPTLGGEDVIESRLVDFTTDGDRSVTFTQQVRADDGLLSQLTVVEVTRVGNAVLVDSSYGAAGGAAVITAETRRLADASIIPRDAMCIFAADPCEWVPGAWEDSGPTVAPTPTGLAAPAGGARSEDGTIPADFPIAYEMTDDDESDILGPSSDLPDPTLELCGEPAWAPQGVVDRIAAQNDGIEFSTVHVLVTFGDGDTASAALTDMRESVRACPRSPSDVEGDDQLTIELAGDTGYDTFTWGYHVETYLGGAVVQVTRVGRAVLMLYATGEMSADTLQLVVDEQLNDRSRALGAQLCLFTDAGC